MTNEYPALEPARSAKACFLGDVRLTGTRDDALFSDELRAFTSAHDLCCANFEGAAAHAGAATNKRAGPAVLQGAGAAKRVRESGVNLVTLANNHAMDYGEAGLAATLEAFQGVPCIGAAMSAPLAYAPYVTTIGGVKLGFLSLTERQYGTLGDGARGAGCAWINDPRVLNSIRFLRAECNHVIVLCHAGLEEVDQPLPQWRALYRRFADAGASVIVGTHPHVPQGWERYKDTLIFYSLGNAAWEPGSDFPDQRSLCLSVTFPLNGLPSYEIVPVAYEGGSLTLLEDADFSARMDAMNRTLAVDADYEAAAAAICRAFYEGIALPDFFTITGSLPGGLFQRVKNAVKLIVRKPALNRPLLLSMLENESYRWAVEHALRTGAR